MIVRSKIPWQQLLKDLWPAILLITLYTLVVSWLDIQFHLEELHLPIGLVVLPGTTIGVLMAFRTNSCYERWWEARIIWGRIVNDSRSWVRQLLEFVKSPDKKSDQPNEKIQVLAHRQIAWCYTLARSLRGQDPLEDCARLLESADVERLRQNKNVPNAILLLQAKELRALRNRELIDSFQFVALEKTLTELTNSMGGCERILKTPFPPTYGQWIHYLIYLFILMLPFALVDMPWYALDLVTIPIAMGFLIIDKVAYYLEDPFTHRPSSTPVLTISRAIEINIREMLGEREDLKELEPVKGVLY